jgi:hypothetical protein
MNYNVGDSIQNKEITRVSEHYVFFGDERISHQKINKILANGEKIVFAKSPDIKIDWGNYKEVLDYQDSFKRFSTYISQGCKYYKSVVVEVKDGIAEYDGINHLRFKGSYDDWCKKPEPLKDGYYYVRLYKKGYGFYSSQPTQNYLYLFISEHEKPYTKKEIDDFEFRNNYKFKSIYNNVSQDDIEHILKLDLRRVNSNELEFIKGYQRDIFKHLLPFKSKCGVIIDGWCFNSPLKCSRGLLYVDNSYWGNMVNGFNYGVILKFHPEFSNEHQYYTSTYIKDISRESLESAAIDIKNSIKKYSKL